MSDRTPTLVLGPHPSARSTPTYPVKGPDRRPIVAFVSVDDGRHAIQPYSYPTLTLSTVDADGSRTFYGVLLTLTYQRHRPAGRPQLCEGPDLATYYTGFLGARPWSGCYGEEISARSSYGSLARVRRGLDLYERAREAYRKSKARTECALLGMVIGLRRIGVEIRIDAPEYQAARELHRGDRQRERERLAEIEPLAKLVHEMLGATVAVHVAVGPGKWRPEWWVIARHGNEIRFLPRGGDEWRTYVRVALTGDGDAEIVGFQGVSESFAHERLWTVTNALKRIAAHDAMSATAD